MVSHKSDSEDFLPPGLRPKDGVPFHPEEGYRFDTEGTLIVRLSRERTFELFQTLIGEIEREGMVAVSVNSSHNRWEPVEHWREDVDASTVRSVVAGAEDFLKADCRSGVSVMDERGLVTVEFDEHKELPIRGRDVSCMHKIVERHGIRHLPTMDLISKMPHVHPWTAGYDALAAIGRRLGIDVRRGDFHGGHALDSQARDDDGISKDWRGYFG